MQSTITATELSNNTRKVIDKVQITKQPLTVTNYGKQVVVIIDLQTWETLNRPKHRSLKELEKFMIKTNKKINSAEIIRKNRDEE